MCCGILCSVQVAKKIAPGLFGPSSVSWRVNRESILLLGGGRALLMQLAHPAVAAGVDEHSDFRQDPVRRLLRTLELSLALTFGTREEALASARMINRAHLRVRGKGYSATDPTLLLWVHATLIDSALVTYEAFVRPLAPADRAAYYDEARSIGALLGVPEPTYPRDIIAFDEYVREMPATVARVGDRARWVAAQVLRPPIARLPGALFYPSAAITAGLLPRGLREAYRLPWGLPERLLFKAALHTVPWLVALAPGRLRNVPGSRRSRDIKLIPQL